MTLTELTQAMRAYNGRVAYGSECNAWQDYLEDMRAIYQASPLDDTDEETEVSAETEDYWLDVANGNSDDYDPDTGSRTFTASHEW